MHREINISEFIIESVVSAKQADPTLELIFDQQTDELGQSTLTPLAETHGQQRCTNLTYPFARGRLSAVPIKRATFLVPRDLGLSKCVLEITLNTTELQDFEYEPGDTIGILPSNREAEVQQLLVAMRLADKAHQKCCLKVRANCGKKTAKIPPHIPATTTPHEVLRDCLNLHAVPKKQLLRALADCCSDVQERDFLNSLSAKEGAAHYNTIVLRKGFSILQLLELCPSCQPTLELLAEHLPRLLPRPYSIANSPLAAANEIKIVLSVLNKHAGLTSDMLAHMASTVDAGKSDTAPKVLMYPRNVNDFRFTVKEAYNTSQILIGIGTGVAPFLGFLEHKQQLARQQSIPQQQTLKETWLFAGSSTPQGIPQRALLLALHEQGILNRYLESFSRAPEAPYRYVQDQLVAQSESFVEMLLRPTTILYVCADGAEISKSIENSIQSCMMRELKVPQSEVMEMLKEYRANGKYREDLWI